MQTARYHRDQAELCLQMARSMSDPQAANVLRASAARHFEQAIALEKGHTISDQAGTPSHDGRGFFGQLLLPGHSHQDRRSPSKRVRADGTPA
jgi:hypothetical protein